MNIPDEVQGDCSGTLLRVKEDFDRYGARGKPDRETDVINSPVRWLFPLYIFLVQECRIRQTQNTLEYRSRIRAVFWNERLVELAPDRAPALLYLLL